MTEKDGGGKECTHTQNYLNLNEKNNIKIDIFSVELLSILYIYGHSCAITLFVCVPVPMTDSPAKQSATMELSTGSSLGDFNDCAITCRNPHDSQISTDLTL